MSGQTTLQWVLGTFYRVSVQVKPKALQFEPLHSRLPNLDESYLFLSPSLLGEGTGPCHSKPPSDPSTTLSPRLTPDWVQQGCHTRFGQRETHFSTFGDFCNREEQENLPELRRLGGLGTLRTLGLKPIGCLKGSVIFSCSFIISRPVGWVTGSWNPPAGLETPVAWRGLVKL